MAEDERELGIIVHKGSRQRLRPFVERAEKKRLKGAAGGYKLMQVGLEKEECLGTWDADDVDSRREIWFDEVMEMVAEATETEGTKTAFWIVAFEADGRGNEKVMDKYKVVAQPGAESLSPSPEGLVKQAMTHTNRAFTALLSERGAVTQSFKEALSYYERENKRLQDVVLSYQRREDELRDKMWSLMERERELIRAEAMSESSASEVAEARIERIVDKLGNAAETLGVKMVEDSVAKMSPEQLMKFFTDNKDLVKLFMGQAEGN